MEGYSVEPISYAEAKPWIKLKHYAHRMPCVQYAYGIIHEKEVCGVIAYGPTCRSLNRGYGIFGGVLSVNSFELLRLCIDTDKKNIASFLISQSLKQLEKPAFVVSYADANQGHVGYVYQATNWLYCGITSKEKRYIQNGKELHARSVVSMYGSRKQESLPDSIEVSEQEGKHRYVMFLGSKKEKKAMGKALKYPILPYPKGETKRYDASAEFPRQIRMF